MEINNPKLQQKETQKIPDYHVAVMDFQNNAGERFKSYEKGIADFAIDGLKKVETLVVLERTEIQLLLQEIQRSQLDIYSANPPRQGRLLGAHYIATGVFSTPSGKLKIEPSLANAKAKQDGSELLTGVEVRAESPFEIISELVPYLLDGMGIWAGLRKDQQQAIGRMPTNSMLAFLAYCEGLDAMDVALGLLASAKYKEAKKQFKEAEASFERAYEEDRRERAQSGREGEFSLAKKRLREVKFVSRVHPRGTRLVRIDHNTSKGFSLVEDESETPQVLPSPLTVDVIAEF